MAKPKRECGGVKKRAWWESQISVCKACDCLDIQKDRHLDGELGLITMSMLLCGSSRTEGLWRTVGFPLSACPHSFLLLGGIRFLFRV